MGALEKFNKKKEFLICIDSDGCAIDSMNIKHIQCFGPCMVKEWNLEKWEDIILKRWNEINLYTMTRGTNRFLALSMALSEIDKTYHLIEGIKEFKKWAEQAAELSNQAVEEMYKTTGIEIFDRALSWSKAVNQAITQLPEEAIKPFHGVKEGLQSAQQYADVAIVSSANAEAVQAEWKRYELLEKTDICLTQNEGSKAYCIKKMLEKGYQKNHVLMIGDAPGDKKAAESNGVLYYPILVRQENKSWDIFLTEALPKFLEETYEGSYQEQQNQKFEENLA